MTVKDLYQDVVNQITEINKSIEYLKGKREALNGVRLDLKAMIDDMEKCRNFEEQTGENKTE